MPVTREQPESMLKHRRGYPDIVSRNGRAGLLKLVRYIRVEIGGFRVYWMNDHSLGIKEI